MSKKKKKYECGSYADMENLMVKMDALDRQIGVAQAELDELIGKVDTAKAKIKERAKERAAVLKAMEKFAETRKGLDFTGEKNSLRERKLKRGVVGFRLAPKSVKTISRDWTEEKCVAAMKELMKRDPAWKKHAKKLLIRVKETLNKDVLKDLDLDQAELAKAGLKIDQEDLFWAKTAHEMETEEVDREKKGKAA